MHMHIHSLIHTDTRNVLGCRHTVDVILQSPTFLMALAWMKCSLHQLEEYLPQTVSHHQMYNVTSSNIQCHNIKYTMSTLHVQCHKMIYNVTTSNIQCHIIKHTMSTLNVQCHNIQCHIIRYAMSHNKTYNVTSSNTQCHIMKQTMSHHQADNVTSSNTQCYIIKYNVKSSNTQCHIIKQTIPHHHSMSHHQLYIVTNESHHSLNVAALTLPQTTQLHSKLPPLP